MKKKDPSQEPVNFLKPDLLLSFIGLLFSIFLVYKDITKGNFCPKIFTFLPACYPALVSYLLVVIAIFQYNKPLRSRILFLTGDISGFILGAWCSFKQLTEGSYCATFFTVPLCYLSLLLFIFFFIHYQIYYLVYGKKDVN